jgi:DNA polymerase III alpha subunit (gram-positive type)
MTFLSIDIETTGLDRLKDQILEFGAVLAKTDNGGEIVDTFRAVFVYEHLQGNPFAINMNRALIEEMLRHEKYAKNNNDPDFENYNDNNINSPIMRANNVYDLAGFWTIFNPWLRKHGLDNERLNLAGKNLATFDLPFLMAKHITIEYSNRIIDPAILYYQEGDKRLPDLQTCMDRAGIEHQVSHTAVDDAMMVAKLVIHRLCTQQESPR